MLKTEVLERIAQSWQALQDAIRDISDPAASAVGLNPNWSIKDALSHIVAWENRGRQVIDDHLGGAPSPSRPSREEVDAFNAKAVEERRARPFREVVGELEVAHKKILETVESLPDEIEESSVTWLYINGVTIHHMAEHAVQIKEYLRSGPIA